jgi:hypothetical protein
VFGVGPHAHVGETCSLSRLRVAHRLGDKGAKLFRAVGRELNKLVSPPDSTAAEATYDAVAMSVVGKFGTFIPMVRGWLFGRRSLRTKHISNQGVEFINDRSNRGTRLGFQSHSAFENQLSPGCPILFPILEKLMKAATQRLYI